MDTESLARLTDAHSPEGQAQATAKASARAAAANALLDRIEAELNRLKRARPHLEPRITKAGHILTAHFAGRPAMPIIRGRISKAGKAPLLFNSLTGNGAVYCVDPKTLDCSCPAAHRYGGPCKHALCAFILLRVSGNAPKPAEQREEAV